MLGYSRGAYAAAVDGAKIFGRENCAYHKKLPLSLKVLAIACVVFSLTFKMKHIIDGILAMRIMVQFGAGFGVSAITKTKRNPKPALIKYPVSLHNADSHCHVAFIFMPPSSPSSLSLVVWQAGVIFFHGQG
jgi:hypothetical protein